MSPARPARYLTHLVATATVAAGLTLAAPPAGAQVEVPVTCDRGDSPTELRWDDVTYRLRGTCGVVRVLADDVTVRMPTAQRLVVRGHRNTVVSKSVATLVVRGTGHDVRPVSVQHLRAASRGTTVAVEGLVEAARLTGRATTLRADRLSTLRAPGTGHTVRVRVGYDAFVGGDANTLHYRRLDAAVLGGDANTLRVRRGATDVRDSGHRNRLDVHRRG